MVARLVGVEEELLLVDRVHGAPISVAASVIALGRKRGDDLNSELQRQQVEIGTRPCASLDGLAEQVRETRSRAASAAQAFGAEVAALATSPVPVRPSLTPSTRFRQMSTAYALTADEQLTCGCHVHVDVTSPEEGVGVLDRIRPWLPILLALSANSPFWQGIDTGYASWRQQVWGRWPSSGPTELFSTAQQYQGDVAALVGTAVLLDEGMIYFDARLSRHYPTVEIRVADVCLHADDTVLLAALVRALVDTAARAWQAGEPPDPVRTDLLRLAMWRASRSGLHDDLVHPLTWRPAPAADVVNALLAHLAPALDAAGDLTRTRDLLRKLLLRGNGSQLQRAAYETHCRMSDVVADAVSRTLAT
ncbi:MAG: glutamate--cysteine ligase [Mycobacteriaceae bacterium]|nr:glutamate--cysteine ligase [Mycobacteriaceae bacterium]